MANRTYGRKIDNIATKSRKRKRQLLWAAASAFGTRWTPTGRIVSASLRRRSGACGVLQPRRTPRESFDEKVFICAIDPRPYS